VSTGTCANRAYWGLWVLFLIPVALLWWAFVRSLKLRCQPRWLITPCRNSEADVKYVRILFGVAAGLILVLGLALCVSVRNANVSNENSPQEWAFCS